MRRSNTELKINVISIRNLCVSIVFIAFIVAAWVVFSQWSSYQDNTEKITNLQQQMISTEKSMESLKRVLSTYGSEMSEFQTRLFNKTDVPSFMKWLSLLAEKYNVALVDIREIETTEVPKEKEDIQQQQAMQENEDQFPEKESALTIIQNKLIVQLEGNFDDLSRFITAVEGYKKLLSISNLKIQRKAYPLLKCEFDLRLYILKEKEINPDQV